MAGAILARHGKVHISLETAGIAILLERITFLAENQATKLGNYLPIGE